MVAHGFPGGNKGYNYRELYFLIFVIWALIYTLLAFLLWIFGRIIVPLLPRCKICRSEKEKLSIQSEDDFGTAFDVQETDGPAERRSNIPRRRKGSCVGLIAPISLFVLFAGVFLVYIFVALSSTDDSEWTVKYAVVVGMWVLLAIPLYVVSDSRFAGLLLLGLPATCGFYLHAAAVQIAIWDMSEHPGAVAFLGYIPLAVVTVHLLCASALRNGDVEARRLSVAIAQSGWVCATPKTWFAVRWAVLRFTMKLRPKTFWGVQVGLVVYSALSMVMLASGCMSYYNTLTPASTKAQVIIAFSTWLTRSSLTACPAKGGAPCHIYLSAAYNMSDSMIVNAHTAPSQPPLTITFVGGSVGVGANVSMQTYPVAGLERGGSRDVHAALLTGLQPSSTYTIAIAYGRGGTEISKTIKFRTGPANNEPFTFTSGGDMGNTVEAVTITSKAATLEPLFAMVGGDVAYGNALRACYYTWDVWLTEWETRMVTPTGYSVPVVMNIGNHDVGATTMDGVFTDKFPFAKGDVGLPLVFIYFPQQNETTHALQAPYDRLPYHSHVVGTSTVVLSMDSGYVVPFNGAQLMWAENALTTHTKAPIKIALYHVPIFPVNIVGNMLGPDIPGDPNADREVPDGLDYWVPLFDKHNVAVAFENHVHSFKRSYPLVGGKCIATTDGKCSESAAGTVFLGDGYWGIYDGFGRTAQDDLLIDPHPIIATAALRYHVWFMEANGTQLTASAVSAVPCPSLKDQVCDGVFDSAEIPIADV
eukprot:m.56720 g.56720  ORF g.56720 m.56720 type:complete len:758 (-) comp22284_c1_seq2:334-2607(-)